MKEVAYVSYKIGRSDHSEGAVHSNEGDVHRPDDAPCLLCLRAHSRGDGISCSSRALGDAANISTDTWREPDRCSPHPHLLSKMFHEGPGGDEAVLPGYWNVGMIPLADSPHIDASPFALNDASRRAPNRERGLHNHPVARLGAFCPRCSGLLLPSDTASLERDVTGAPVRLWRHVNCGDCVDHNISTNRWKGPGPARRCARPRRGPQHTGQPSGVGTGMTR